MLADQAPTQVLLKYSDYATVFSSKLAMKLLESMGINKYAIKLVKGKQPLNGPIYSLGPVKL